MTPRIINFHITDKCNYHCQYCFAKFHQKDLSLEDTKRVIDNIADFFKEKKVHAPRVNIAGGEPLLYPHLDAIIDHIHAKGIAVSIITNASALTVDRIDSWKGRVASIGISVDAVSRQTNLCIGRCQYGEPLDLTHLFEVADAIHQNGIALKINTVVSKLNLAEDMKPVYMRLQPDKIKFLAMHVIESANGKASSLAPTVEEFYAFIQKNEPDGKVLVIIEEPGSMENSYFMIDPHGDVYMNDHGDEKRYGCCLDQPLTAIYTTIPLYMEKYMQRYSQNVKPDGFHPYM